MDRLRNNVKIVFPILVILQIITSVFAQKVALNTPEAKEMQAVMENVDGPMSWMIKPTSTMLVGFTIIITIIGIAVAYFICKAIYKKINSGHNKVLEDFNKNHFSIMSFKYTALILINLMLVLFFKQEKAFVMSVILTVIVVLVTIAGANLIFSRERYDEVKTIPNLILYGIMSIF